jgi:hypothetical protein
LVIAALSVLTVAAPTQAQTTPDDCIALIGEGSSLRTATADAEFIGKNSAKDEAALLGKLDSATVKLGNGKVTDAIQALTQFRDKVADLNSQGKIASDDAQTLLAQADTAIVCLQQLPEA